MPDLNTKDIEQKISRAIIANQDKYFLFAARPASIQRIDLLAKAFNKYLGAGMINMLYQNDDSAYFFSKYHFKRFSHNLWSGLKSTDAISKHLTTYYKLRNKMLDLSEEVKGVKANRTDLLKIFRKQQRVSEQFSYYFITTFGVDDYIFPKFQSSLKKCWSGDKYEEAIRAISAQTKIFGYQEYQLYLLSHKKAINYDYLIRKYNWLTEYSYKEPLLNKEMIRNDCRSLVDKDLRLSVISLNSRIKNNQRNLQKILAEITDKDLRASARLINEYINIKTDRIEVYKKLQANFRIFFEKLVELWSEQRPALQYDDCISMIDEEIIAALRGNLAINPGLLKKRFRQDFVSIYQDDRLHFVYDKSLIKKIRNIFLSVKNSEVSGLVVSKGRVKGLARLIKSKADFSKFKAGEILVCNFTTPDYIPLMNKAAGIITDDGGITCHAAIISRELNKPCIVGTKSATRTIKTGDLLDLDADQGIIKILSA